MRKFILLLSIGIFSLVLTMGCKSTVQLGSIKGIVTLDGTPSSNIAVSISGTGETATTDANGSYSFTGIIAGSVILNFTKSGYSNESKSVTVIGGSETIVQTVNLSSSYGSISGTVRLESEVDYSGITVSIWGTSSTVTTNTSGSYSFSNLASGSITLVFSKSGYTSVTLNTTVVAGQNTSISVITLPIEEFGNIIGTASLFGESSHSGVSIYIDGILKTTTATNGTFSISNVSSGSHSLTLTKSGYISYSTSNITVQTNTTTNIGTTTLYKEAVTQNVYDMSTLQGNILTMTYFDQGYLVISTDSPKLYLISTADASVSISATTTENYTSLLNLPSTLASLIFGSGTPSLIEAMYTGPTGNALFDIYTSDLSSVYSGDTSLTSSTFGTVCIYDSSGIKVALYNKNTTSIDLYNNGITPTYAQSIPIDETGLNSIGPNSTFDAFYACNSQYIYKYSSDFLTVDGCSLGTSNLVGVAYDGTYIWAVDATTKKLYKIVDDL